MGIAMRFTSGKLAYFAVLAAVFLLSLLPAALKLFADSAPSAPTISLYPSEFATIEAGRTTGPMAAIVTNTAGKAITISATSLDDLTNFSMPQAEDGCVGKTLTKKNDYCTIVIYFQPQTTGHISTNLSVTYYGSSQAVSVIAGRAFVPPITPSTTSVDFGQKTINTERETRTVLLTNNALIPVEITSIAVSSTPFDADQDCVKVISAGGTCELVIGFNPTAAQTYTAHITIRDGFDQDVEINLAGVGVEHGEPDIGLSTTAIGFGQVQAGGTSSSQSVTLISAGTVALTITNITVSGDFSFSGDCIKSLAQSEFCTIAVTFAPQSGGERTGSVSITDNASDSPQSVALTGIGISPGEPVAAFSTTSLDFGSQTIGTRGETLYVVLENVGDADLTVTNVTASGDFSQTGDCVGTTAADGRCGIAVTFAPTITGEHTGTVTITDNAAGSPHTINLAGNGTSTGTPHASLSSTSLDFGEEEAGTPSIAQTITLTNTGDADLSIGLTTIDGEGAAAYGKRDTCRESVVEPGTSCTIDVIFTPSSTGSFAAMLSIDNNTSDSPSTVSLIGTGITLPPGGGCNLMTKQEPNL